MQQSQSTKTVEEMPPVDKKRQAAKEVIDILHEISTLLVRDVTYSFPADADQWSGTEYKP